MEHMPSPPPGRRKQRVSFRQNRASRARSDEWTQRFRGEEDTVVDALRVESIRPKGEMSRKRTVIEDDSRLNAGDESCWQPGVVTVVHGLFCTVDSTSGRRWECTVRRVLRTRLIENRSAVTVGDRVWFSDHSRPSDGNAVGVIERVEPRQSELARRDRRGRGHVLMANADQLLIVASIAQPGLKPHLIDRYVVAAAQGRLRPLVCFNKIDLQSSAPLLGEDLEEFSVAGAEAFGMKRPTAGEVCTELRRLGYTCLETSAAAGIGLEPLRQALRDHVTVLAGQSGVGKSSLLNAIQPGLELTVDEVSRGNEKGRHTTTHARLLRLDGGGYVVDTPGVRAFELWDVQPNELEVCFVEFAPHLPNCRFRDCLHFDELDCAVRAAAEAGRISGRRYMSYRKMYIDAVTARKA